MRPAIHSELNSLLAISSSNRAASSPGNQSPVISHAHHSSWVVLPAKLYKQGTGDLALEIKGPNGAAAIRLHSNSANRLRNDITQHRLPEPQIPTVTEIKVSPSSDQAVWNWHGTDLILQTSAFSQHFSHLAPSFKDFINSIVSSRRADESGSSIAVDRHKRKTLSSLPYNTLEKVGGLLSAKDLAALSRTNKFFHDAFKPSLNLREIMAPTGRPVIFGHGGHANWRLLEMLTFGGKQIVRDLHKRAIVSDSGIPEFQYPPVLDAHNQPVRDANGEIVRRNPITSHEYFSSPADKMPTVQGPNGTLLHDKDGNIVRQMPTLNRLYFDHALELLATANLTSAFRKASLNTLGDVIRTNPVPEYEPELAIRLDSESHVESAEATIPDSLKKALQSNDKLIRHWAAHRVDQVLQRFDDDSRFCSFDRRRVDNAIYDALLKIDGYRATVGAKTTRKNTHQLIQYGQNHKSLFYGPDQRIRFLAEALARRAAESNNILKRGSHKYGVKDMNGDNEVYKFKTMTVDGVQIQKIPKAYDAWLLPMSLRDQQVNMAELIILAYSGSSRSDKVARGIAEYLVRNIAHWPADRIRTLLLSPIVRESNNNRPSVWFLESNNHTLLMSRQVFVAALGEQQRLPEDILRDVDAWMRTKGNTADQEQSSRPSSSKMEGAGGKFEQQFTWEQFTGSKYDGGTDSDWQHFGNNFNWQNFTENAQSEGSAPPRQPESGNLMELFNRYSLPLDATKEEATKFKRDENMKWHPDKHVKNNMTVEDATQKTQQINDDFDKILAWIENRQR